MTNTGKGIIVVLDGKNETLIGLETILRVIEEACENIKCVSAEQVFKGTLANIFDGISLKQLEQAMVMTARTLIEEEPNYSYVASRLLLKNLQFEVMSFLSLETSKKHQEFYNKYTFILTATIYRGVQLGLLSPKLLSFNLNILGENLKPERDFQFNYIGLQTLYDRYLLHNNEIRFEMPQIFFMRVAMGLAVKEENKELRAIEFYDLLSSFDFMCPSPTLFNSGTLRSQLSSGCLTTIPDNLTGIFNAIKDNAILSSFGGGIGNDWTSVRAMGATINGTNGKSQGVIPFLKIANDTAIAVNQGGKRKGAVCAYLETWHLDIEFFLELRKNTGDERWRTHDMNTANWIPDLFMKRVFENKEWTLFSPDDVVDLHDNYGNNFEKLYVKYEKKADCGEIKNFKRLPARALWRKMLNMLYETGHPWITFKDTCNLRSPQSHVGVIHSSNLCTEVVLNTSIDEIAGCNLGTINLAKHIVGTRLDFKKLENTIKIAVRMLDNVIDLTYYPVPQAMYSNLRHRPIGIGIMGFQDTLYKLGFSYASPEAIEFSDRSMEYISFAAISASCDLAKERGAYDTFHGSLWNKGILPIDSIELLRHSRGNYLSQDSSQTLNWQTLRERVKTVGMRNSTVLAIAPTATISNICGVSQSIEPTYQNLFVKSNLSGEFTIINSYLVEDLKILGLWDKSMLKDLKIYNGSVQKIERIPQWIKIKYVTAFEIDPKWLIEAASRRQKWIDQSQSLNLYINTPSGKKLDSLYREAWLSGLKTCYYLRSLSATDVEKSTVYDGNLNAVQVLNSS